jgi:hypothetical protein
MEELFGINVGILLLRIKKGSDIWIGMRSIRLEGRDCLAYTDEIDYYENFDANV